MAVDVVAVRLLGLMAGGFLYGLAAGLLWRRPWKNREHWSGFFPAVAMCLVCSLGVASLLHSIIDSEPKAWLLATFDAASMVGLSLAAALLCLLTFLWAGRARWGELAAGLTVGGAAAAAAGGKPEWLGPWLALSVACSAAASLRAGGAPASPDRATAHFRRAFGVALLAALAGLAAGRETEAAVLGLLAPVLTALYFIYRYHAFDLLLSRRFVYLAVLASFSTLYLLAVRAVAALADLELDWFSTPLELILILAAGLLWLPLYSWIFGLLARRAQRYGEENALLVQQAVRILDLQQRRDFLTARLAAVYGLRRAVIQLATEETVLGGEALARLRAALQRDRPAAAHLIRAADPELRRLLASTGFNYLFPLWRDETHLTGLLWIDSAPRVYLDELEAPMVTLAREIAHSLEACRLVEDKIALERALVRQEHLATLGKAAATIAHEVKNPLSSIKTLAQLMREDPETQARFGQDLDFIIGETDRLNSSVQQLLTFSRPASGQPAEFSLSQLLEEVAGALEREYAPRQIRVEYRVEPALRVAGADRQSVQQIVLNLALNALQASSAGGRVLLEASRDGGGQVVLRVTDEGPGVPPDLRERIFEPFFTTKQQGTGLGLAIVQKNVRHLGGELELISPVAQGHGTCFTIRLPAEGAI